VVLNWYYEGCLRLYSVVLNKDSSQFKYMSLARLVLIQYWLVRVTAIYTLPFTQVCVKNVENESYSVQFVASSEHYLSVLVYMHPMMFTSMFLSPLVSLCLNIPLSMFQYKVEVCLKYWMHEINLVGAKSVSSHEENSSNFSSLHVYQSANTWYRIQVFKVSNL
jgi:hypothetical protein